MPEQLRSVEEILNEIDDLNDELRSLEEELSLWSYILLLMRNIGKAIMNGMTYCRLLGN